MKYCVRVDGAARTISSIKRCLLLSNRASDRPERTITGALPRNRPTGEGCSGPRYYRRGFMAVNRLEFGSEDLRLTRHAERYRIALICDTQFPMTSIAGSAIADYSPVRGRVGLSGAETGFVPYPRAMLVLPVVAVGFGFWVAMCKLCEILGAHLGKEAHMDSESGGPSPRDFRVRSNRERRSTGSGELSD